MISVVYQKAFVQLHQLHTFSQYWLNQTDQCLPAITEVPVKLKPPTLSNRSKREAAAIRGDKLAYLQPASEMVQFRQSMGKKSMNITMPDQRKEHVSASVMFRWKRCISATYPIHAIAKLSNGEINPIFAVHFSALPVMTEKSAQAFTRPDHGVGKKQTYI